MLEDDFSYRSFCWVLGTTSFRTAQLNLRIEEQLLYLEEFKSSRGGEWRWESNPSLQSEFYDFLHDKGALVGDASRKDKDARQKTSGLVTLGLSTANRELTEAGLELLTLAKSGEYDDDNNLMIAGDSLIYLRQLLKASVTIDGKVVRPFLALSYLLTKFQYLSDEEFEKLMPLVTDPETLGIVTQGIERLRNGNSNIDEVVLSILKARTDFLRVRRLLVENSPTIDLISTIGINRKSRKYDEKYFPVYERMADVFLNGDRSTRAVLALYLEVRKLSGTPRKLWLDLLFGGATKSRVEKDGMDVVPRDNEFLDASSEEHFKSLFVKYMHLFKAYATLADYADLNRRYFKLTDTLLFADAQVKFDTIPQAFFALNKEVLRAEMFIESEVLTQSVPIGEISASFNVDTSVLLTVLSEEIGQPVSTLNDAAGYVELERYQRLHEILDEKLTLETLIELLDCFKERNDERISELVTDSATPSTVFEYTLGLVWYELSGRTGDILTYMNLQLEADLMPRSHAPGGKADIAYVYPEGNAYPSHTLLLEATLSEDTNSRRMEMEPVSRHLGEQIHESGNLNDYCVFVAPVVDINVANDFRSRKRSGYYPSRESKKISSLKIIPLGIEQIKNLLWQQRGYADAYHRFDAAFRSDVEDSVEWLIELEELLRS